MSQKNEIYFRLTEDELSNIQGLLSALNKTLVPKLKALTPADRHDILKLGEKSQAFVTKSYEYAIQHPELVPPYLNLEDMKINMDAVDSLRNIHQALEQLAALTHDSLILSGSDAYSAALVFYESVKVAAKNNFSSAQTISEDLSKRFNAQGHKKPKGEPKQ